MVRILVELFSFAALCHEFSLSDLSFFTLVGTPTSFVAFGRQLVNVNLIESSCYQIVRLHVAFVCCYIRILGKNRGIGTEQVDYY